MFWIEKESQMLITIDTGNQEVECTGNGVIKFILDNPDCIVFHDQTKSQLVKSGSLKAVFQDEAAVLEAISKNALANDDLIFIKSITDPFDGVPVSRFGIVKGGVIHILEID
jgi:hypothetical protein